MRVPSGVLGVRIGVMFFFIFFLTFFYKDFKDEVVIF